MGTRRTPKEYLKVKVETADSTELLLMLFEGALRFANRAKEHMEKKEYEEKNRLFLRAQNILLELIQTLDQRLDAKLYNNLTGLYRFCYEKLVAANLRDDKRCADEAIEILEHLRETWRLAVDKYRKEVTAGPRPPEGFHFSIQG